MRNASLMICMQIGQRKSLSMSDMVGTGETSPAAVVSVEKFLEGSGFTTAGTRGPTECSSMVRFRVDVVLLREKWF